MGFFLVGYTTDDIELDEVILFWLDGVSTSRFECPDFLVADRFNSSLNARRASFDNKGN
jgi:hypothetical protein